MNTAYPCYSDFFGIASSRTGLRFDTVEVWGSSPHVPTISSIRLERIPKNSLARDQPVIPRTQFT